MHECTFNPSCLRTLRLLGALILALLSGLAWATSPAKVGEITLRLGEAWVLGPQGERRDARTQAPVHAGEAIQTAASGHVHIRFIDGAVISVRPNSRLVIAEYGDPTQGGAVRLRLERGSTRSVTGRYGEADRSRFRLNTPIVAIGINGTDFLVQTADESTRVAVFSGSIIAAPFDEACRPEGLGPCRTEQSVRLSADMGSWLLEIRQPNGKPQLLPRSEDFVQKGNAAPALAAHASNPAVVPETTTQVQNQPLLPEIKHKANELTREASAPLPAALAWGRWAHAPVWPSDHTALTTEVAEGRERVAENVRYALYRLPQTQPLPTEGQANLSLASAQAHLIRPQGVLPAQVLDGALNLDFAQRRYATTLTLDSSATGLVPFAAAGSLNPDGRFGQTNFYTRLQGAWGTGGAEPAAAYWFEHSTAQGLFMGITAWR